jgi:hypothetical protein
MGVAAGTMTTVSISHDAAYVDLRPRSSAADAIVAPPATRRKTATAAPPVL